MLINTQDSHDIADFLTFLSACYDGAPGALRREGASDAEIARVVSLAQGHSLPAFYEAYLREFGRDNGLAKIGADGGGTVADILEYYADATERERTPPGTLVVNVGALQHMRSLVWQSSGDEPPIGCFLIGYTIDYLMASSFRHLCYQSSWEEARFGGLNVKMVSKPTNALADAGAVFAHFGASRYWFSDEFGVYADSGRCACSAVLQGRTTFVAVAAPTPAEREQIYDELRVSFGFR